MVGPGNPPHCHTSCAAAHPASPHHRLVALAARSPGRRPALSSETEAGAEKATVMLAGANLGLQEDLLSDKVEAG
jgi:hypothetical protein